MPQGHRSRVRWQDDGPIRSAPRDPGWVNKTYPNERSELPDEFIRARLNRRFTNGEITKREVSGRVEGKPGEGGDATD